MVSSMDLTIGIVTLFVLFIGYSMSIITLRAAIKKEKVLLYLTSLLFIAIPSAWLGSSWMFLSSVFTAIPFPSDQEYVFAITWAPALMCITWIFITVGLLKHNWLKNFISSFIVADLFIFMYFVYFEGSFQVKHLPNTIYHDMSYSGLAKITFYLGALSLLLTVPSIYFWTSFKVTKSITRFRTRLIAIGCLLYTIAGSLDATLALNTLFPLLLIRLLLISSLLLLYLGYNTPLRIRAHFAE